MKELLSKVLAVVSDVDVHSNIKEIVRAGIDNSYTTIKSEVIEFRTMDGLSITINITSPKEYDTGKYLAANQGIEAHFEKEGT